MPLFSRLVSRQRLGVLGALLCLAASAVFPPPVLAGGLDDLSDLTDKAAQAVVTLKGRDNFNSEYLYDVSVKNLSSESLESRLSSFLKDYQHRWQRWMAGTSDSNLTRMEILRAGWRDNDGKPYFWIPCGSGPVFLPTPKVVL